MLDSAAAVWFIATASIIAAAGVVVARRPSAIYEYPYFMSAVVLVFVVPQAISLLSNPGDLPLAARDSLFFMVLLCLASCFAGYYIRPRSGLPTLLAAPVDEWRLGLYGLVLVPFGYYFLTQLETMSDEEKGGSMWTGLSTIYLFFSGVLLPAAAIALHRALRSRTVLDASLFLVAAAPTVVAAVYYGRRESAVFLLLTVLVTAYFVRAVRPSRIGILLGLAAAAIVIPSTHEYRSVSAESPLEGLNIPFIENFVRYLTYSPVLELRNAGQIIDAMDGFSHFTWGAGYWNELVHRFVPAQFVGQGFKEGLKISAGDEAWEALLFQRGVEFSTGSTVTGFGDAYKELGYLGCLFFGLLGQFFRRLWELARRDGILLAQLFYVLFLTSAMRAITHQTVDFLPGALYFVLAMAPGILFASVQRRSYPLRSMPR